jgi:hypothetical protein
MLTLFTSLSLFSCPCYSTGLNSVSTINKSVSYTFSNVKTYAWFTVKFHYSISWYRRFLMPLPLMA